MDGAATVNMLEPASCFQETLREQDLRPDLLVTILWMETVLFVVPNDLVCGVPMQCASWLIDIATGVATAPQFSPI